MVVRPHILKQTPEFISVFLIALTYLDSDVNCRPKTETETLLNILD